MPPAQRQDDVVKVRSALSPEEARDAILCLDAVFPEHPGWLSRRGALAAAVSADPSLAVVAVDEGRIAGAAISDGSGCIDAIGLDAAYRRQGVGSRLLRAAEEVVRSRGGRRVTLGSVDDATGFYLACGYQAVLLVQFRSGERDLAARAQGLEAGPLQGHAVLRSEWEGSPQLFVQTGAVDFALKRRVEEFDSGAECCFVMGKDL
ncbi:MAG: GNAT family N-acetyltransferase [Candidatus Latescibacterota bacterium]